MTLGKNEILDGMYSLIQDGKMTTLEGHMILTRELIARYTNKESTISTPSARATGDKEKLIIIGKLLELKEQGKLPVFQTKRGRGAISPDDWIKSVLSNFFEQSIITLLQNEPEYWYQVDKSMHNVLRLRRQKKNTL